MKLDSTNTNLTEVIESLYSKATSAVYYNGSVGEWFRTTVGVRQVPKLDWCVPWSFQLSCTLSDMDPYSTGQCAYCD